MEEKIKEKEKVRINVLFTKTIEILLMVFALWTAGNFLSPSKNQSPQYETPYEPIENKAVEPEKTEKNSTPLPPNVPIASSVLPAVNQLSNKNVLLQNEEQNKIEAETEWNNTPIFNLPKNKRENELLEEPTLTEVEVNSENFLRKKHFLMPITFATDINYLCEVETDKRKEERKIVDIIISPEYTNVADGVPHSSNKQQVMGFSIGTAASLKLSEKFNFVLGILYNKKIYAVRQHYQFLASNQFSLNSLHDLKLHTLQLQPMIQYDAVENDKFRAYATAGVGANFVMHTEQIAQEFTLAAGINNLNTPDPAAAADTNFSKRGAVTDFGIIDGGNVQSNFFVTLNLGVGVEYQLNTDWSIFIQPTYQQALSPFSDRNDYFNTFALVIGAKVAL